jgi:hypothetical protein
MCSRSAARPKCSSSATAMKHDNRLRENTDALLASSTANHRHQRITLSRAFTSAG